ncbi:MAG TPA: HVO_0476 family zinc finger protein [Thermoplasmata archaeon]|nr:HVO_0476 family zinc finger protein [Thermoplasmata archaeon]
MEPEPTIPPVADDRAPAPPALASAALFCERCGRVTVHRVFRVRGGTVTAGKGFSGVARCRDCRWTHPFESAVPSVASVDLILSDGRDSVRRPISLPPHAELAVGDPVPDLAERAIVRRIDVAGGRSVPRALASRAATVWAVRDVGAVVKVSVIVGARTRTDRLVVDPGHRYEVGAPIRIGRVELTITALRARGHTWRKRGDAFAAGEVERLYARRTARPPAGRSDWSSERERPRSRARATSAVARSRSSPGVSRHRTSPRARTAASGAAIQRSSSR